MTKLGKKARKFAKKNLQSVDKKRRQRKSLRDFVKRKRTSNNGNIGEDHGEDHERVKLEQSSGGNSEGINLDGAVRDNYLDNLFGEDNDDLVEDVSDSDGSLTEDPDCPYISESENEIDSQDMSEDAALLGQNRGICMEIKKQNENLDRLKDKDPQFSEFVESRKADLEQFRIEETYSDEEGGERSDHGGAAASEALNSHDGNVLTSYTIDVWCWLVMKQRKGSALPNLLNAFRAACHYGVDSDEIPSGKIPNKEVFSKVLTFVLCEADGIFRRLLGISDSLCKESILKLGNRSEWKTVRPLMKSYLRNSLFLLNQVTDCQILVFALSRLRPSIMFFAAFPSLAMRLIKIAVHLWATGEESLSLSSFFIIRDIASQLNSECLETCLIETGKAFIAHSKFIKPTNLIHIEFLKNSIVELYSLDIPKSYQKVLICVQQLASILGWALKTKKKEELKKIYNWQYIYCIDLWVRFITCNIKDHDLRPLLFLVIPIIRGIAHLFPGPRYLPLRLKCLQMLNQLSLSSGVFIPVASLVLDCLEYRGSNNADKRHSKAFNFSSLLKVPKQSLKSRDFQEEGILSAIELLSEHFSQWSYHISFPELATIPLILLKKLYEKTTVESLRRPVKRLIDQVEQNSEFVRKKRDEVAFSPDDLASAESFLKLEKSGANSPFTKYYASVRQNSLSRDIRIN